MVSIPRRLASSKARTKLAELPLVDRPTAMSFRPPNAASWRAKTTSTPTSFHSAVTTEVAVASPKGGRGREASAAARVQEQGGELGGIGGTAAVAEGEQPPAGREPGRRLPCAVSDPG